MSLVTAQGRQARSELEEEISRLSREILVVVKDEPKVVDILDQFASRAPEDVVREAVWRLIDQQRVELTSNRRLHRLDE